MENTLGFCCLLPKTKLLSCFTEKVVKYRQCFTGSNGSNFAAHKISKFEISNNLRIDSKV